MKQIYLFLFFIFSFASINAQIINFPDVNFKAKLLQSSPVMDIAYNINGQRFKIDANSNGEIEQNEALAVYELHLNFTNINDLTGINYFTNLREIECYNNFFTSLDLTGLVNLVSLHCYYSQITELNISNLANLETLYCYDNWLTELDLRSNTSLVTVQADRNNLEILKLSGLSNLTHLSASANNLETLDFTGLGNVTELYIHQNQFTTLDFSGMDNLMFVNCDNNPLTSLNVSNNAEMLNLMSSVGQLTTIDVSALTNLTILKVGSNLLTELDISGLTQLHNLNFSDNQISEIDLSDAPNLKLLYCNNNLLTQLDISHQSEFDFLWCNDNQLTSLDTSMLTSLQYLRAQNNNLEFLNMKGGPLNSGINSIDFSGNNNLQFVCVDDFEQEYFQDLVDGYGYSNTVVSSYCTFVPGGEYFAIEGNAKYDFNANGCDANDVSAGMMLYEISNGSEVGRITANTEGNFSIYVANGIHTVVPILENAAYFNVLPNEITVDFPTDPNPFEQDFCITANGTHPDLEIELIPLGVARPGFDAHYKILYHNKGNQTQSGSVIFNFDDELMDYVDSTPEYNTENTNEYTWDFTDLKPFESRSIEIIFNLNSPSDTPPLNIDDTLVFQAAVYPISDDETPSDNSFQLNQLVVGSLDPNDKTCLQGESVGPETAGEYVHYLIRFENTGNYPAENIVVKDVIDTEKFEVSTLRALNGSHEFYSRIKENVVEFIFENINLPFDDQNNDGYVLFKIKTKPELQLGDTFSNEAAIYFDYNFPVITNEYITTIEEQLETADFDFGNEFVLYPNPSKNILNIQKKATTEITSVEIYNMLGQVVIAIPSKTEMIDVSSLKAGTYFVKLNSNKGKSYSKFIKE